MTGLEIDPVEFFGSRFIRVKNGYFHKSIGIPYIGQDDKYHYEIAQKFYKAAGDWTPGSNANIPIFRNQKPIFVVQLWIGTFANPTNDRMSVLLGDELYSVIATEKRSFRTWFEAFSGPE